MKAAPLKASLPRAKEEVEESMENSDEGVSEVEIPDEAAPPPPPRKTKADFPKQWIRMDAKYQCCYCKKLFFTKMETESCFNGHFDENGVEIEPS
jgi:hypothetical protein